MKINDFSKLTNVPAETIRLYRQKGFLHPVHEENGYWDYSIEDFVSLTYLRKQRAFQIGLDEIKKHSSINEDASMLQSIRYEQQRLKAEIEQKKNILDILDFEYSHIEESLSMGSTGVSIMHSLDEKIDYFNFEIFDQIKDHTFLNDLYQLSTATLRISASVLNGPIEDREIPLRAGIGTYRFLFEKNHHPIPEGGETCPNGIYISQLLKLTDLSHINIKELAPMMNYAKENKCPFQSDTTAYLLQVRSLDETPVYIFRIRACIRVDQ